MWESRTLRKGSSVPDFELPDEMGNPYRLSDHLEGGPMIILFFPSVWGMMCAVEMSTIRDMYASFVETGAKMIACSTNSSMSNAAWSDHMRIPFPVLSDFDGATSAKYGILEGEEGYLKGRANRAVFIVDKQMVARYVWVADDPAFEPDYEGMVRAAREVVSGQLSR